MHQKCFPLLYLQKVYTVFIQLKFSLFLDHLTTRLYVKHFGLKRTSIFVVFNTSEKKNTFYNKYLYTNNCIRNMLHEYDPQTGRNICGSRRRT